MDFTLDPKLKKIIDKQFSKKNKRKLKLSIKENKWLDDKLINFKISKKCKGM